MKAGDWFKLQKGNDWGRVYLSRAPQGEHGTNSSSRRYRLDPGDMVRIRLSSGRELAGVIHGDRQIDRVSDMGRSYDVTSTLLLVSLGDGLFVKLEDVAIVYEPDRDPTAWEIQQGPAPEPPSDVPEPPPFQVGPRSSNRPRARSAASLRAS